MSRKLKSQYVATLSILAVVFGYMFLADSIDGNVVFIALLALGVDAATMKGANAIGDHGAFKKEASNG